MKKRTKVNFITIASKGVVYVGGLVFAIPVALASGIINAVDATANIMSVAKEVADSLDNIEVDTVVEE